MDSGLFVNSYSLSFVLLGNITAYNKYLCQREGLEEKTKIVCKTRSYINGKPYCKWYKMAGESKINYIFLKCAKIFWFH